MATPGWTNDSAVTNRCYVGRVANLRPIANRPPDGALNSSNILSNIRGTGRLAIGRGLATRPT
jgi:hypothetical protein